MKQITKCCKIEALETNKGYYCSDIRGGCGKLCEVEDREVVGNLIEADKFNKDIKIIRCHAIMMKDEHGQVIYTFDSIEKADDFYKTLTEK